MNFLSLVSHLGLLLSLGKEIENWVGLAVQQKNIPKASDSKALLDKVRELFDSGLINIPGVDDKQISDALKMVEDALCPPTA